MTGAVTGKGGSPMNNNKHLQISILLQAPQKTYKVCSKEINKYTDIQVQFTAGTPS
jgi:hypothetical protein